jgi:NhaP-type Na+/H+ or K+/H+ antiporter
VAGLACRRVQKKHRFHRRLYVFSEAIEHALSAILLVLIGSTLPALWPALDWRHSVIGFSLLLVIRPVVGWLALKGTDFASGDRWIVGFFGVRGVGSIYYIAFASGHVELINERPLWALVAFTVFASAVIHGTTSFLVDRFVSKPEQGSRR